MEQEPEVKMMVIAARVSRQLVEEMVKHGNWQDNKLAEVAAKADEEMAALVEVMRTTRKYSDTVNRLVQVADLMLKSANDEDGQPGMAEAAADMLDMAAKLA